MTQIQGVSGNSPIDLQQDSMEMEDVNPYVASHVESAQDSLAERVADLEQQITDTDDPQQQMQLQDEIMDLEGAFEQFQDDVSALSAKLGDNNGFPVAIGGAVADIQNSNMADELRDVVSDFRNEIADSYAEFGTADVPSEVEDMKPAWCPVGQDLELEIPTTDRFELPQTALEVIMDVEIETTRATPESDGAAGTDETSDTGATSGASETGDAGETSSTAGSGDSGGEAGTVDGKSPSDMVNLMSNDPDAFYEQMQGLDPEDRMMMQQTVQQQLQEINQMNQMMSQFSQAIHDTHKAVIQNLRV